MFWASAVPWPGKVEVVLNYQAARLIMALLHCFSSVPVLCLSPSILTVFSGTVVITVQELDWLKHF